MFDLSDINGIIETLPSKWDDYIGKPTASSFAKYVYLLNSKDITYKKDKSLEYKRLEKGIKGHLIIEQLMNNSGYKDHFGGIKRSEWEFIYADNDSSNKSSFTCSKLTYEGKKLKCKPDLLLRYKKTENYLIIERKTTRVPAQLIPSDGWDNVQAQLWVYSWMDKLNDAERVYLAGDFWTWNSAGRIIPIKDNTVLPFFEKGESEHERKCEDYFIKWGGKINRK